jgi:hypothetical protein
MGTAFWIKRFTQVSTLAFVILLAFEVLKGGSIRAGWIGSASWALISAAVFTATRIYRSRQGQACALCRDLPET